MSSYVLSTIFLGSDDIILKALGEGASRARIAKELTQAELAVASGVSSATIARLEGGDGINLGNLVRILRVLGLLERLGALFPDPNDSPLAQLERSKGKPPRQRVRHTKSVSDSSSWTWGDETQEGTS